MAKNVGEWEDVPKNVGQWEDVPKPTGKSFGQKALEVAEPSLEMLGTIAGGAAGSFLGPAGTVGGAGLGYGITKEALHGVRRLAGYDKPRTAEETVTEPIKNVLTGATYEAGGRALPEVMRGAGKIGSSIGGLLSRTPETRAAKIVSESLGSNVQQARQVLKSAANDVSASQALAVIDPKTGRAMLDVPTTQALLKRAEARDPEFYTKMFGQQDAARIKQLEQIAGGSNQTAAREARDALKKELNNKLIPTLKTELEAANIAGKMKPKLAGTAEAMEKAAKQKVEDVRRFTAAGPRGEALARSGLIEKGQPVGATKYTYLGGELPKLAERVATDSAEGSLRFGDAARFARAAEQSLEAHGLRPLTGESVVTQINRKLSDPSVAGNRELQTALSRITKDISQWTNKGGVIDAFALDAIRKNSINSVAKQLFKDDKKAQKEFAGKVLEAVKPVLIDAVENAGGTGYRQYLTDYAKGSQAIGQSKLGAELLHLYQANPNEFIRVVEGNSPEKIEQIFGPGSYSIFKEMSGNSQRALQQVSGELKREAVAGEQAKAGTQRLADVLNANLDFMRLPHWLSKGTTLTNDLLARLEGKVSRETLDEITKAGRSAKSLDELLSKLPDQNKMEALNKLRAGPAAGGFIAGQQQQENQ
jgi:hypothetical protein